MCRYMADEINRGLDAGRVTEMYFFSRRAQFPSLDVITSSRKASSKTTTKALFERLEEYVTHVVTKPRSKPKPCGKTTLVFRTRSMKDVTV